MLSGVIWTDTSVMKCWRGRHVLEDFSTGLPLLQRAQLLGKDARISKAKLSELEKELYT
jgi:hypothetical protein